jgi:hypothetical protein
MAHATISGRRPPGISRTEWRDRQRAAQPAPSTKPVPKAPAAAGRTLCYVRVSTDQQAEDGQSLEVQQRQLEGWAVLVQIDRETEAAVLILPFVRRLSWFIGSE